MTVIVNQSTTPQEFSAIIQKMSRPRKTFNARQFCGKVKFHKDPMTLQKMWREAWSTCKSL